MVSFDSELLQLHSGYNLNEDDVRGYNLNEDDVRTAV